MLVLVVIVGIVLLAFFLWPVLSPGSFWTATYGWRFRNQDAVEPSNAWLAVTRVSGAVAMIVVVVLGIVFGISAAHLHREESFTARWGVLASSAVPGTGFSGPESAPSTVRATKYHAAGTSLQIGVPVTGCSVQKVSATETSTTVTVTVSALAEVIPAVVPSQKPSAVPCDDRSGPLQVYSVTLGQPVGSRTVVSSDGTPLAAV